MNVNEVKSITLVLTNEIFVIPSGARSIDMNNTGGAEGKYKGNGSLVGRTSEFVTIGVTEAYSYGEVDKPYGEITIDATGTIIEISVNY